MAIFTPANLPRLKLSEIYGRVEAALAAGQPVSPSDWAVYGIKLDD